MDNLFKDTGFLGAVVGAISGLIGAALGGFATYYASLRQYRTEHQTKQNSALAASLVEMCRNQSTLIRELDRVLPIWLARCYDNQNAAHALQEVTTPIPKCDTRVFDSFFTELIASQYGSELKTYYDRIGYVNQISNEHSNGLPPEKFAGYVRALALAVEVADDLASELQRRVSKTMPKNWGKEDDFGGLADQRDRALYLAALYRTRLSILESYIAGKEITEALPPLIIAKDKSQLNPWVIPARELMKL